MHPMQYARGADDVGRVAARGETRANEEECVRRDTMTFRSHLSQIVIPRDSSCRQTNPSSLSFTIRSRVPFAR